MQTERLRQLADLIEKRGFLFDQTSIGKLGIDPMGENCGYAGCLADWAYRIYSPDEADAEPTWRRRTAKIGELARKALDLNERQAGTLFSRYWPNWWIRKLELNEKNRMDVLGFEPTARQAAQALRRIAEMNEVPASERDCQAITAADIERPMP